MYTRLLFLLFLSIAHPITAESLPDLGHPSEQILTPEEEIQMGKAFVRALKAQASFVEDELVNDYVKNLGYQLAANSPEQGRDFNFFVINANNINAFAGPNATIGINKGLILAAKNESQLASVMAHEIAHVTQKHLTRAFQASENSSITTIATVLAGILVSSADPTAGAALVFGGVASGMQSQINFTRGNEYEADRVGIQILDSSNINPKGMTEFFEILQSSSFYGSENDIEYLRTHPLNSARIAEAASRTPVTSKNKPRNTLKFQLSKVKLLVAEHDNPAELLKDYKPETADAAMKYTKALIELRINMPSKAVKTFKSLINDQDHLWYQLGLAEAYLQNKQLNKSLSLYNELLDIYPDYLPVIHAYARALIKTNNIDKSISILEKQMIGDKNSITYDLLAQSYSAKKELLKAYSIRAERYANDGFYEYAIQQLTNAIKLPDISTETIRRLHAKIQIYKKEYKTE